MNSVEQPVTLRFRDPAETEVTADPAPPGVLTYAIVMPPAHGTLSGTAPELFYTPECHFVQGSCVAEITVIVGFLRVVDMCRLMIDSECSVGLIPGPKSIRRSSGGLVTVQKF